MSLPNSVFSTYRWFAPGGAYFTGQWIWDTMFVVDLLSILPDKGFDVIALPMKIAGGSGGPLRIVAVVP